MDPGDDARRQQAQALHDEGVALADAGDKGAALAKYMAALALDLRRSDALYNLGLHYKYKGAWAESLRFNKRSVEIQPDSEAANWNLAIAVPSEEAVEQWLNQWVAEGRDVTEWGLALER